MPESRNAGLARALSKLGYCSRSQAAELIRAGRVTLNGRVRRDPEAPVNIDRDSIAVDGKEIETPSKLYLMMNKPRGVVTTARDEKGRKTVYDLLDQSLPWIAPVGRLDKASEGLLLFTNDSAWAARITDPARHIPKTYHVQIAARMNDDLLISIRSGVMSRDERLSVVSAELLRHGSTNSWLEIVLDEGKNRHIRRIFDVLEIEVLRLIRVAIGQLVLGSLPKRAVRPLTIDERRSLA